MPSSDVKCARADIISWDKKKGGAQKMNEPCLEIFTKTVKSANAFEYSISTGIEGSNGPITQSRQQVRRN